MPHMTGGGVADMYNPMVPLLIALGVDVQWHIAWPLDPAFFSQATKPMHDGIQGILSTPMPDFALWEETNRANADLYLQLFATGEAILWSDDPQTALLNKLLTKYLKRKVARLHIDTSGTRGEGPGLESARHLVESWKEAILIHQPGHPIHGSKAFTELMTVERGAALDLLNAQNGVLSDIDDIDKYSKEIRDDEGRELKIGNFNVLVLGRADPAKGMIHGLLAFAEYLRKPPNSDSYLWIFLDVSADDPGTRAQYKLLKDLVDKNGIGKNVQIFTEYSRKQRSACAAIARKKGGAGLILSTREGYNLALSWLMWQGLSVVATDLPAFGDRIEHGKIGGWLVTLPQDIAALDPVAFLKLYNGGDGKAVDYIKRIADSIVYARDNKDESAEMSAKGKESVKTSGNLIALFTDYLTLLLSTEGERERFKRKNLHELRMVVVERIKGGRGEIYIPDRQEEYMLTEPFLYDIDPDSERIKDSIREIRGFSKISYPDHIREIIAAIKKEVVGYSIGDLRKKAIRLLGDNFTLRTRWSVNDVLANSCFMLRSDNIRKLFQENENTNEKLIDQLKTQIRIWEVISRLSQLDPLQNVEQGAIYKWLTKPSSDNEIEETLSSQEALRRRL
ncbi:MAG: hypothetical protein KKD90_03280 [Candidatus Omnitrophica bacterium]|nr:hypothetical protein [Candidatus Omnitrophota bacterium]MBU4149159.1 hypothetical protein [Candidatus Omnitrophota bacterium]